MARWTNAVRTPAEVSAAPAEPLALANWREREQEVNPMDLRLLINENDQVDRAISTGKLHALLRFHTQPIDVVVYHGSDREYWF